MGLEEAEEHRSEDYKTLKVSENKRLAAFERLSQVSGLWDDLKIVLKNGLPKNFNSLFYSIICGIFAQSLLLALRNIYLLTHMVTAMMKGDKSMFWRSFWYHIGHGIVSTWVDYYMLKWHCDLQQGIYKSMTNKMMNKYISKVGYYSLKTLDKRITDPEMRITDDIDKFAASITQLQQDLVTPLLKIFVLAQM